MKLDLPSILVGLIVVPLLVFIAKRITSFLKKHSKEFLDATFWVAGRFLSRAVLRRFTLSRYCGIELARPLNKYLRVPGKTPTALLTDSAFVPLQLQEEGRTFNISGPAFITSIIDEKRVRIIGDPGSGKSSFVKKTFREACYHAHLRIGTAKLPILVELKDFTPPDDLSNTEELGEWGVANLKQRVSSVEAFETDQLFESYVKGDGIFVFFDGLDEVSSASYPLVSKALRALSLHLGSLSKENAIWVTMRSQFHQQIVGDLETEFPILYRVKPFTPVDVYEFLSRWPDYKGDRESEIVRIYGDLTDRPTLREMCSNPLVLAMYVSNDQSSGHRISPDTRTEFYSQVVEELLVLRRSAQLQVRARTLLKEQRERLLGSLAFRNLCDAQQPANSLSWSDAVKEFSHVFGCPSSTEAEELIREMSKETGIFSEEKEGETFRFIHLTFCEFLAAKEAAEGLHHGWEDLITKHQQFCSQTSPHLHSRLLEVIPFAIALLPRVKRTDALSNVEELTDRQILGRCFLETQDYGHELWPRYTETESSDLLRTPADAWDEGWLSRLHLFNVVLHDQEGWARAYSRSASLTLKSLFADLVRNDRDRLVRIFSSYASLDAAAAFGLANEVGVDLVDEQPLIVSEALSYPAFRALIVQRFYERQDQLHKLAFVFANAGLCKERIAELLHEKPAPYRLLREVRNLSRKSKWHSNGAPHWWTNSLFEKGWMKPSLYTCSISYVCRPESKDSQLSSTMKAVHAIQDVPAPESLLPAYMIRLFALLWMAASVFLIFSSDFENGVLIYSINLILALLSISVGIVLMLWPRYRRYLWSSTVNIQPFEWGYLEWLLRRKKIFRPWRLAAHRMTIRCAPRAVRAAVELERSGLDLTDI